MTELQMQVGVKEATEQENELQRILQEDRESTEKSKGAMASLIYSNSQSKTMDLESKVDGVQIPIINLRQTVYEQFESHECQIKLLQTQNKDLKVLNAE